MSKPAGTKTAADSAFLTQKGERIDEVKKDIANLEELLAGSNQTSQSTALLKKRKEMREVDESLEEMKKDYKKRIDDCEERRIQFELKQAKMRDQVLKFEKFIQENDAKRQRADLKAKQERKSYEEKCRELSSLNDALHDFLVQQKELESSLVSKSCYKVYLEHVINEADHGYEEMSDILNRYQTLSESNDDLLRNSQLQDKELDQLRYQLQAMRVEKQNQLLVSNSLCGQKQKELEKMRSVVKGEEEEKDHQEDNKKKVSRELSQILQAIRNIFNRCQGTSKSKVKAIISSKDPWDAQLELIHSRMKDLLEIEREFQDNVSHGLGIFANMSLTSLQENSTVSLHQKSVAVAHHNSVHEN